MKRHPHFTHRKRIPTIGYKIMAGATASGARQILPIAAQWKRAEAVSQRGQAGRRRQNELESALSIVLRTI
jgi:hypothetical protein